MDVIEIIYAIKNNNTQRFADLYKLLSNPAYRTAKAILKDHHLAMDAVEDTFIKVYYNLEKYDATKSFKAWFFKILTNECLMTLRKNKKIVYLSENIEIIDKKDADDYKFIKYEIIYKEINKLDEKLKIPIILKYLHGFKEKELAQILSMNINTVKTRLKRGKEKLRKVLSKEGGYKYAK